MSDTADTQKPAEFANAKPEGHPAHPPHTPANGAKPIGDPKAGAYVADGPAEPDDDPVNGGGQLDRDHSDKGPVTRGNAPSGGMR